MPERVTHALTTVFSPLFLPPVMVVVVAGFVALDVWLFGVHGISQGVRHVLYSPRSCSCCSAASCSPPRSTSSVTRRAVRYGGAEPGVMGVGIYIVWPAFYTDITDAYRLGKAGPAAHRPRRHVLQRDLRARDAAALYALTGFEPLLLLVVLQNVAILQQSLPLLRLDGYYIVSDLTGVPDILARIRPVLAEPRAAARAGRAGDRAQAVGARAS